MQVDKKDMPMMIGLGAIIVVALGGLIYHLASGGGGFKQPDEYGYRCRSCGNQWSLTQSQVKELSATLTPADFMAGRIPCPQCDQKSAIALSQCPGCKGSYAPAEAQTANPAESICPHCKIDINEWYRNNLKR